MYTATITSITQNPSGNIKAVIEFSDGTTTETKEYNVSSFQDIKQAALSQINYHNSINDLLNNPPLGQIDFSTPVPSDIQLAEQNYQIKRSELMEAKQDLDLGIITQSDFDSKLTETLNAKV